VDSERWSSLSLQKKPLDGVFRRGLYRSNRSAWMALKDAFSSLLVGATKQHISRIEMSGTEIGAKF
jgi:hypothetical protein